MPETSERIAELRRELESNPGSRQFYQLGELLRREGRATEAVSVLRAGLSQHPRYVAAWVSLGRACLDRGDSAGAATALHEAIDLDAQNPVAWRLLGEARLAGGDRFGALDAMQHALQLAPGDEVLRAAVDALQSETWPPSSPQPEASPLAATQPLEAAAPPASASESEAAQEHAAPPTEAPAGAGPFPEPAPGPARELEWPAAAAEPAAAGPPAATATAPVAPVEPAPFDETLSEPFAAPPALVEEAAANVFELPRLTSFAEEPFGIVMAPAPPDFLAEVPSAPGALPAPLADVPVPEVTAPPMPEVTAAHVSEAGPAIEAAPPALARPGFEAGALAEVAAAQEAGATVAEAAPAGPEAMAPAPEEVPAFAGPEPEAEGVFAAAGEALGEPMGAASAPEPAVLAERPPAAASAPMEAGEPTGFFLSRPTLTLARVHIQQQDFPAAIAILEQLVAADPDNQEARDLLELVHDMMAPLPGELPPLSLRERKIAALQGWLASLALGRERLGL